MFKWALKAQMPQLLLFEQASVERDMEPNKREKCKAAKMHRVPDILFLKKQKKNKGIKSPMCPNERAGNCRALKPKGAL